MRGTKHLGHAGEGLLGRAVQVCLVCAEPKQAVGPFKLAPKMDRNGPKFGPRAHLE